MKKVVLSIGAAAIIVLAAINVNIALKSEGISKSIMANIVALADSENPGSGENGGGNGGGISFFCTTYTSETNVLSSHSAYSCKDKPYCVESIKQCNNGVFSWCYPGSIQTYYDCSGVQTGQVDNTYISGCN
jgi:hypothetical protein